MIIGVIGDRFSGKKTFADYIKVLYPDTKILFSVGDKFNREFLKPKYEDDVLKNKFDSPEFKIDEIINKESTWLENHLKVIEAIENYNLSLEEKEYESKNENKKEKKFKLNIKDIIRGLKSNLIILDFSLEDFNTLQTKSSLRLVRISSNTKKRFSNFQKLIYVEKEKEKNEMYDPFMEFLDLDEQYMKVFPQHLYKNQRTYTIVNDSDLDTFYENIKNFWDSVTKSYRPSWDDYFMTIADNLADRSNCIKLKVGAITVKNNRILSSGFNGTPNNLPNCFEGGCPRCKSSSKQGENLDSCICIHAEINCIIEVGKDKLEGACMYVTFFPCLQCCKQIIQSGIKKVVFKNEYNSELSKALFKQSKIEVRKYNQDYLYYDKNLFNTDINSIKCGK